MRAGGKGGERKSPSIFPLPSRTFEEVVTTTGSASFTASSKCINTGAARAITSQKNQLPSTQNHCSNVFQVRLSHPFMSFQNFLFPLDSSLYSSNKSCLSQKHT